MARIILYPAIALVAAQSAGFGPNTGQAGAFQPHNPVVFATPFPAGEQQFQALPLNQPRRPFDAQFQRKQDPDLFARPVPVTAQQWSSFQPRGRIVSITPQGWFGQQLDVRFAKPFPTTEQVFQPAPESERFPTERYGWWGQQFDLRFATPVSASLQQYTAIFKYPDVAPPQGWWGQKLEYQFAKPFPIEQQLFSVWDLVGDVPVLKPPGAGKRYHPPTDYLPRPAYDAKKNPKFRPVWDKPLEGKVEQHPQPAPIQAPLPPAALLGAARPPAINPAALPQFDNLVPHDPLGLAKRMQESRDLSDALAVLRKLGLIG